MDRPDASSLASALQAVLAAFPEDACPPEEITIGGRWFDEEGRPHAHQSSEAEDAARFFEGRPWTATGAEELLGWGWIASGMIWMTPAARAYYLPTYLKAILTAPPGADWVTALEALAWRLTPPEPVATVTRGGITRSEAQRRAMDAVAHEEFRRFLDALTAPQRSAVTTFLTTFERSFDDPDLENPITTALDRQWRRS